MRSKICKEASKIRQHISEALSSFKALLNFRDKRYLIRGLLKPLFPSKMLVDSCAATVGEAGAKRELLPTMDTSM
jgi:hypothetical protein